MDSTRSTINDANMSSAELFGWDLQRYLAGFLQRYLASSHDGFLVDWIVTHDADATSRPP
jgi:hypothetical protein